MLHEFANFMLKKTLKFLVRTKKKPNMKEEALTKNITRNIISEVLRECKNHQITASSEFIAYYVSISVNWINSRPINNNTFIIYQSPFTNVPNSSQV